MAKGDKVKAIKEYSKEKGLIEQLMNTHDSDKLYAKYDAYQKEYDESIDKFSVVIVDDKAGTGKTTIAVRKAFDKLRTGRVDKIQYIRFPDPRNGKLGFLPGDLDTEGKLAPFMRPFYDAAAECGIQKEAVDAMISKGLVELGTDIGWRGGNMKGTFLIIDEAQNGSKIGDVQLIITRVHDHRGHTVLIGHSEQADWERMPTYGIKKLIPFQVWQIHLMKQKWTTKCNLPINYRGKISQWADRIWETVKELEIEVG